MELQQGDVVEVSCFLESFYAYVTQIDADTVFVTRVESQGDGRSCIPLRKEDCKFTNRPTKNVYEGNKNTRREEQLIRKDLSEDTKDERFCR